ncbi:HIT domain-containing protein [Streptomyces decoyicus]|uniref:HIT domain-containing protein n=1 Tax=Streptomyces decoyicus TaxID=249567 RepID=UPI00386AB1E4|nr:HIT domain-containing protein [Streptomyces decoyicus]
MPTTVAPVRITSYGARWGAPPRHDTGALVLDVRDWRWDPADTAVTAPLVPLTGLDPDVRDYVLSDPEALRAVERTGRQVLALQRAVAEEAVHLYVACWYGRHRAPAVARAVADWLAAHGTAADVEHRDITRPLIHREPARQLESCVFCRIAAGAAPAQLVRDWPEALAIVPRRPVTPGHLLVVPRRHVRDVTTDPAVTAAVMQRAAELGAELAGDLNLITAVGPAATQTVFHAHVHLVPRRHSDGLPLPWTPQQQ